MTASKWTTLVRQCLLHRASVQQFDELLAVHEGSVDGKRLAGALVECREMFTQPGDPLVSLYLEHIGVSGLVKVPDILIALIGSWNEAKSRASQPQVLSHSQTLQDLATIIASPRYKTSASEMRVSLFIVARWLAALAPQTSRELTDPSEQDHSRVVEPLAFLLASMATSTPGLEALSLPESVKGDVKVIADNKLRTSVRQAFEHCIPLYSTISPQIMEHLNAALKHINLLEAGSPDGANTSAQSNEIQALQFQVSIADSQLVASKAATTIFLESLLFTGSTIDDGSAINWLSERHQNDYPSMFNDLLVSSFRIFNSQSSTPKRSLSTQQCQLFIQNKLPALLSMISASSFNSFSTEQATSDAWHLVAQLPSTPELLPTGARFLHTCSLHHLISPQLVGQLAGNEESLLTESKSLHTKDEFVAQIASNHVKGPKLVDELARNDGNVGPISQALVEIMHTYCHNKEIQYLKDLANAILRKPAAIEHIAMFIRPSHFLGPLCALLDEWRWDEIHGEAQPVYDEFGAIFLLILVTKTRLALPKSGLGIRKKDGFLAEYFAHESSEQTLESLTEERRGHLGSWINALYLSEGLSDELFTNCSPHDFYLLIPTLLRQSISALQQGKLTEDTLKAGLEYLLEPFLLPSLIPTLRWAGGMLRDPHMSTSKILEAVVKPPGTPESREIHQTILAMCAPQLKLQIQSTPNKDNSLDSISKILNQCPEFSLLTEREHNFQHFDDLGGLQNNLTTFITSASASAVGQFPTTQDIPSLVSRACELRGAEATLRALTGVLLRLSDSHDFLFALDTVATVVYTAGHGLRDALRLQYTNLGRLLKSGDTLSAEAVVRLQRQVETYSNLLTVQEMGLDAFAFSQQLPNIDTSNSNLDMGSGLPDGLDLQTGQDQADGIDQVLDEVAAMGNLDSNDADMSFDALYGLQGGDMDLNDLDLDMF